MFSRLSFLTGFFCLIHFINCNVLYATDLEKLVPSGVPETQANREINICNSFLKILEEKKATEALKKKVALLREDFRVPRDIEDFIHLNYHWLVEMIRRDKFSWINKDEVLNYSMEDITALLLPRLKNRLMVFRDKTSDTEGYVLNNLPTPTNTADTTDIPSAQSDPLSQQNSIDQIDQTTFFVASIEAKIKSLEAQYEEIETEQSHPYSSKLSFESRHFNFGPDDFYILPPFLVSTNYHLSLSEYLIKSFSARNFLKTPWLNFQGKKILSQDKNFESKTEAVEFLKKIFKISEENLRSIEIIGLKGFFEFELFFNLQTNLELFDELKQSKIKLGLKYNKETSLGVWLRTAEEHKHLMNNVTISSDNKVWTLPGNEVHKETKFIGFSSMAFIGNE